MKGEMDFSDPWFRKRFRDEMEAKSYKMGGETPKEHHERIASYLWECGVTLSTSGKMAYDRNLKANNCSNMFWPGRDKFVDWARVNAPEIFKKRGAKPPAPRVRPARRIQKPAKPKTTGWDDFDWSR